MNSSSYENEGAVAVSAGAPKKSGKRASAWTPILAGRESVGLLYTFAPAERIVMVREGVPAAMLVVMSESMGTTRDRLFHTVRIPRATADRKIRDQRPLSPEEGERVVGVARLIGQVDAIVRESGGAQDFDAARWLAAWIEEPNAALDGQTPSELLDTAEGRDLVAGLLHRMQTGAYA